MYKIFVLATTLFDPIHHFWESKRTQSRVAGIIVALFLLALAAVQLNRWEMAPSWMAWFTPTSHFFAVDLAFGLVLMIEVVHLVFTVPCSISRAVGTQFEILALILLRSAFKELSSFPEPIDITGNLDPVYQIVAAGAGALLIFALLGIYRRVCIPEEEIKKETLFRFVSAKKIVALVLLAVFVGIGVLHGYNKLFVGAVDYDFFTKFYTVLIFSDILLVLISERYQPKFRSVFRNSGFVLATLLIRLGLSAPLYIKEALGVAAVIYALLLTLTYNKFYAPRRES